MNFFEPSDFFTEHGDLLAREAADMANHKLQCLLDDAPEVFALSFVKGGLLPSGWFRKLTCGGATHKARLFMIEEIR